jgi:alkanesulfonate monooxygenase SsuD/methylene tetrahydromethanopterin reductase-like flavin-dependent oxidoreductase (luciferase family)
MSTAESTLIRSGFVPSSTPAHNSTCEEWRPYRPAGKATRFCCRRATLTLHGSLEAGQRYYADIKGRAQSAGRDPEDIKVFPAATFVLGDNAADAEERARHIRHQQVSGATAIAMLEQIWGRDLSDYDPDGPLPDVDPTGDTSITQGRVRHGDPVAVARNFRERAEAEKLSIRELIIAVTSRQQFVGTAAHIADEIDRYIQADACDGFILVPHLTPQGLDDFVDQVVPLLQERGAYRSEYSGHTLRDHLGLTPEHLAVSRP